MAIANGGMVGVDVHCMRNQSNNSVRMTFSLQVATVTNGSKWHGLPRAEVLFGLVSLCDRDHFPPPVNSLQGDRLHINGMCEPNLGYLQDFGEQSTHGCQLLSVSGLTARGCALVSASSLPARTWTMGSPARLQPRRTSALFTLP